MLAVLHPDEATSLLRQRLDLLDEQIAAAREELARHARDVPRLFLIESEYDLAVRDAEAAWIRGVVAELASGSYPGLAEWRAFHETGEVPAEYAELAERRSPST